MEYGGLTPFSTARVQVSVVKGGAGKAPSGVGRLPRESGTEVVENGVEPPYSIGVRQRSNP
jgi:hypothetical protein